MRITLDIDEDALAATKENAKRQRKLASQLMREALQLPAGQILPKSSGRHGFRPIPSGRAPVSNELVNKMRDELGA